MKVFCINIKGWVLAEDYTWTPGPTYGDVDTVVGESTDGYFLERFGPDNDYLKTEFIPVSEIDETEFERNYKKELV